MFMILHRDKAYDFTKGNLTVKYIYEHILNHQFIERAQNNTKIKDEQGLTIQNYNKHAVYHIKALKRTGKGRWDLLTTVVLEHSNKFK